MNQGDYPAARACLRQALQTAEEGGDRRRISQNLGDLAARQGDTAGAHAFLDESLAMREGAGDERGIAFCLAALAGLAEQEGRALQARALYARSLALHQKLGDQASLEGLGRAYLNLARGRLGEAGFAQAWSEGAALSLAAAIAYAHDSPPA